MGVRLIGEWNKSIAKYVYCPKGLAGWLMLLPLSRLMKKAFEVKAEQFEVTQ